MGYVRLPCDARFGPLWPRQMARLLDRLSRSYRFESLRPPSWSQIAYLTASGGSGSAVQGAGPPRDDALPHASVQRPELGLRITTQHRCLQLNPNTHCSTQHNVSTAAQPVPQPRVAMTKQTFWARNQFKKGEQRALPTRAAARDPRAPRQPLCYGHNNHRPAQSRVPQGARAHESRPDGFASPHSPSPPTTRPDPPPESTPTLPHPPSHVPGRPFSPT